MKATTYRSYDRNGNPCRVTIPGADDTNNYIPAGIPQAPNTFGGVDLSCDSGAVVRVLQAAPDEAVEVIVFGHNMMVDYTMSFGPSTPHEVIKAALATIVDGDY